MTSEKETIRTVMLAAKTITQRVTDALRGSGMTLTQFNALRTLRGAKATGLTIGEIGERMLHAVPDITRLVDRMEKNDWVKRERSVTDRRVVHVHITEAGRDALRPLDRPIANLERQMQGKLSQTECSRLVTMLSKLMAD